MRNRVWIGLIIGVAALVSSIAVVLSQSITSTSDVKIVAQKLEDGRIEFGLEQDGERILPSTRFFPADAKVDRWLKSSEISVSQGEEMAEDAIMGIQVPRYSFITQDLVDRAVSSKTGWATTEIDDWFVAADANQIRGEWSQSFRAWACKDGWLWLFYNDNDNFRGDEPGLINKAYLIADKAWLDDLFTSGMSGLSDISIVVDNCRPYKPADLGRTVNVDIPYVEDEISDASTSITVTGRGEDAEFFTLNAGNWLATLTSVEWCSMHFVGGANYESVGDLDGSSRNTRQVTRTSVIESDGGLSWTDPIGCRGDWSIIFTFIN